jgi:sulfide dehydrogenase [flavocytochrome c] flavoprotein subunit
MYGRRRFLGMLGAGAVAATGRAWAGLPGGGRPKVVVVGGGYGGATAAKYIRMWSGGGIDVTLVDRDPHFISCPLSNLVLGGHRDLDSLTLRRDTLARNHGVAVLKAEVEGIEPDRRRVVLNGGENLPYDRLVVSPGVVPDYDAVPGLEGAAARESVLHAWKAGPQTLALRAQLEAMKDGGVYAIHIPLAPYRCPPGPYERACQVASYFSREKPRSKVLIYDANPDVVSKKGLFVKVWQELYAGMIEYRPNSELEEVDAQTRTARMVFDEVTADVLNVVPPQAAAEIARSAGLVTANDRWCEVDFLTFESRVQPGIHVLGDAILAADKMPKSGHMANQHAKVCADAVVALLMEKPLADRPVIANNCYSFVSADEAIHVASVHAYDPEAGTFIPVPDSGGLSDQPNSVEASYANAWARNIWADMLS